MSKRKSVPSTSSIPGDPEATKFYVFYFPGEGTYSSPIYFNSPVWPNKMTADEKVSLTKVSIILLPDKNIILCNDKNIFLNFREIWFI